MGYSALKETAIDIYAVAGMYAANIFLLVLIDTNVFSQPTWLWTSEFNAGLVNASHPGLAAMPVIYGLLLAECSAVTLIISLIRAVDVASMVLRHALHALPHLARLEEYDRRTLCTRR